VVKLGFLREVVQVEDSLNGRCSCGQHCLLLAVPSPHTNLLDGRGGWW
jgi:hypothetical protein